MSTWAFLRLQRWAERRLPALTRFRRPEALPIVLDRRRIYLMPTAFGIGFSAMLLVMLLGALNYTNNAALLLTCLLGAASMTSMLLAFRTLDGLRLETIQAGHALAGQPLELALVFAGERVQQALRVDLEGHTTSFAVPAHGSRTLVFSVATRHRGWQPLPRLRVWSTWPLGLFRAWSWMLPQQQLLVWPRPEDQGPAPRAPERNPAQQRHLREGDEWAGLRHYRMGDPPRHVAWKASARQEQLLVKEFEQPQARLEWQLDWRQLADLDHEARIARLARWLLEALAQGRRCSLWLPGEAIPSGSGSGHHARCMTALALLP